MKFLNYDNLDKTYLKKKILITDPFWGYSKVF